MIALSVIIAQIAKRMAGQTGSVTLHYNDGALQKIEYRLFEKPQELAVAK